MSSLAESHEYQAMERFIDLSMERKRLKRLLDEVNSQIAALEKPLLAAMTAAGLTKTTINGVTLYQQREPWVRPLDGIPRPRVCEGLKLAGLGYMVSENFNTNQLTAYLKQLEQRALTLGSGGGEELPVLTDDDLRQLLPAAIRDMMNVHAAYKLHTRKKEDSNARLQKPEDHETNFSEQGDPDDF